MKRRIRRVMEVAIPLVGIGMIFLSVLFGPTSLQLQVILVLVGVLILEAGVWGLTSGLLPNERRYLALREEGDDFIALIRELNSAAIGRKKGTEDDKRFRKTLKLMHVSVDRMADLAGEDANETTAETEAGADEATAVVVEPVALAEPVRGEERDKEPDEAESEPERTVAVAAEARPEPEGIVAVADQAEPEMEGAVAVAAEPDTEGGVAAAADPGAGSVGVEAEAGPGKRKRKRKRKRNRRKQRR